MNNKTQKPGEEKQNLLKRNIWFLLLWLLLIYFLVGRSYSDVSQIPYTQFKENLKGGNLSSIHVKGEEITGEFKKEIKVGEREDAPTLKYFKTILPSFPDPGLMDQLEKKGVTIRTESTEASWFATLLITLLPWVLIIGFFVYSSKKFQERMGGGGAGLFKFGKSKAKLYTRSTTQVTYENVAGLANAKKELQEIVEFLKNPSKFQKLGGKLPKGILLAGPPGTGKTLLARATAGEAEVPFYSISGSEFIEMFVGVGASRVRDMFKQAKQDAPAIIFIDELDSIGRVRGTGVGGGHDEREQTLNQILSEMDGFSPQESVIILAATNRPDVLDPALIRPGRFDRRIILEQPHKKARKQILEIHSKEVPLSEDVDLDALAGMSVGFSGADLENLVNEAALIAGRDNKDQVEMADFFEGIDKIRMGLEREDFISEEEKRIIAYHEAGHALMAKLVPTADPLQKVTIVPHGRALGLTEQIPDEDRHNLKKKYLLDRIAIMLGGRGSEKIVFDDVSTGAGNDLKQATQMARRMVCNWGMSEKLGAAAFDRGEPHPFLGKEMTEPKNFSEDTARMIDEEIRRIINEQDTRTEDLLTANRDKLDLLAEALLEHEVLDAEDIEKILDSAKN
ncbi:MAG: ATP-dependent zinc metalloprotease FtsH [Thermodesulfobacteriota bacterium]